MPARTFRTIDPLTLGRARRSLTGAERASFLVTHPDGVDRRLTGIVTQIDDAPQIGTGEPAWSITLQLDATA